MKRSKFTDEQIMGILREQDAGSPAAGVCRRHAISSATFYAWKAKFGGMEVSDAKRLRALEDENAKLKRLLADAMLDRPEGDRSVQGTDLPRAGLKDLLSRKWQRPPPGARPWPIS